MTSKLLKVSCCRTARGHRGLPDDPAPNGPGDSATDAHGADLAHDALANSSGDPSADAHGSHIAHDAAAHGPGDSSADSPDRLSIQRTQQSGASRPGREWYTHSLPLRVGADRVTPAEPGFVVETIGPRC